MHFRVWKTQVNDISSFTCRIIAWSYLDDGKSNNDQHGVGQNVLYELLQIGLTTLKNTYTIAVSTHTVHAHQRYLLDFFVASLLGDFADLITVIITFFFLIKKNNNLRLNDRSIQTAGEHAVRVNIVQSRERQKRVTPGTRKEQSWLKCDSPQC